MLKFSGWGSQAVRLPKEYRIEGSLVRIRRHGPALILEPVPEGWAWLSDVQGPVDADFVTAAEQDLPAQNRTGLSDVFE